LATEAKLAEVKAEPEIKFMRYALYKLVNEWVHVLKRTDEGKLLTQAELIKQGIDDITSGRITDEDVQKLKVKMKAPERQQPEPEPAVPEVKEKKKKNEKKSKK
jgi:hypothetical protein